jgi:hypothetical protein
MSEEEEKEPDGVLRIDTVPPPEGEADAYNAPTRVGQMAAGVIAEMLLAAEGNTPVGVNAQVLREPDHRLPPLAAERPHLPRLDVEPSLPASGLASLTGGYSSPPPVERPFEEGPDSSLLVQGDSLVPRLNEPDEDDDDPSDLEKEAAAANSSFQAMSALAPRARPLFTKPQVALIVVIIALAAAATYLLFK